MRGAGTAFFPDIEVVDTIYNFRFIHYCTEIISKNHLHNPSMVRSFRCFYNIFKLIFQSYIEVLFAV